MSEVQKFWCHEAENIFCVRASDYDALAAQRDEGLAREAELKAQRDSLANEMFDLQQRLAEALDLLRQATEFEVGEIDQEDWQHLRSEVSLALHAYPASPGCADGEKAS